VNVELVINSTKDGVEIALLQDKVLSEMHKEHANQEYAVGDLYLGKVRKVLPSLNAAFVDVGTKGMLFALPRPGSSIWLYEAVH